MRFSPLFGNELAEKRIETEAEQVRLQLEQTARMEADAYQNMINRALRLGKKATRYYSLLHGSNDEGTYRTSKIARVSELSEDGEIVEAQIRYRPPILSWTTGKPIGHDETMVQIRLVDSESEARTSFHDIASFQQNGWISAADTEVSTTYMHRLNPGDEKLADLNRMLGILEAARFTIKE